MTSNEFSKPQFDSPERKLGKVTLREVRFDGKVISEQDMFADYSGSEVISSFGNYSLTKKSYHLRPDDSELAPDTTTNNLTPEE